MPGARQGAGGSVERAARCAARASLGVYAPTAGLGGLMMGAAAGGRAAIIFSWEAVLSHWEGSWIHAAVLLGTWQTHTIDSSLHRG